MTEPRRTRRTPEEARALILEAARRLIIEQGPDAVGLKDVAAAAGVSHALVSHYFGTYEALVEATMQTQVAALRQELVRGVEAASKGGSGPGPEQWIQLVFDAMSEQGHGRLALWAVLSGRTDRADFFARREQGFKLVTDAIEGYLRGQGQRPAREDLELAMLMVWTATLGYAVGQKVLWASLGKQATEARGRRFRAMLVTAFQGCIAP